jgi:hypothetical protein
MKYENYVPHISTDASTYKQEDINMIEEVANFMSIVKYKSVVDNIRHLLNFPLSNIISSDYLYYVTHFSKHYNEMKHEYIDRLIKNDTDTLYLLALEYKKNKQYKKMIWCYTTIIHNGDVTAGISLGDFYKEHNINTEAEKYYSIALGITTIKDKKDDDIISEKINNVYKKLNILIDNQNIKDKCEENRDDKFIDILMTQDKQISKQQKQIDDLFICINQYNMIINKNVIAINDMKDVLMKSINSYESSIEKYKTQIDELLELNKSLREFAM